MSNEGGDDTEQLIETVFEDKPSRPTNLPVSVENGGDPIEKIYSPQYNKQNSFQQQQPSLRVGTKCLHHEWCKNASCIFYHIYHSLETWRVVFQNDV